MIYTPIRFFKVTTAGRFHKTMLMKIQVHQHLLNEKNRFAEKVH